jgi:hypothetical protein
MEPGSERISPPSTDLPLRIPSYIWHPKRLTGTKWEDKHAAPESEQPKHVRELLQIV